eukprot:jgi/Astpho2/405/Aster-x0924
MACSSSGKGGGAHSKMRQGPPQAEAAQQRLRALHQQPTVLYHGAAGLLFSAASSRRAPRVVISPGSVTAGPRPPKPPKKAKRQKASSTVSPAGPRTRPMHIKGLTKDLDAVNTKLLMNNRDYFLKGPGYDRYIQGEKLEDIIHEVEVERKRKEAAEDLIFKQKVRAELEAGLQPFAEPLKARRLLLEMLEILEQVLDREMNWEEGRDAMEDAVFRSNHQHRDSSPLGELMLQRDAGEAALPADKRQAPGTPSAPGLAPEQVIAAPPVADSAQGAAAAAAAVAEAVALVEAAGRAAAAATVAAAITSRAAGTSSGPASAEQKPERSVIERLMHRLGGLFNLGGGLGKSELPQSQPALPTSQSALALLPKQRRALLAERGDWRAEAILANAKQAVASARRIQLEVEPDAPTYPAGPPIAMGTMEEYEELMHLMQLAEVATQGLGEDVQHEALRFALATFKNRCRYRELGRDPGRLPDNLTGAPATGKAEAGAWAIAAAGDDGKPEAGAQAQLQGLPATNKPEAGAQATAPVSDAGRPAPVQMPPGTPADERDPVTHQGPAAVSEAQVVVEPQAVLVPPTASDEAPGSPQAAEQQLVPQPAPADASKALEGKPAVEAEPKVDHEPERPPPTAEPQADSVEAGLQPPVSQEPVAGGVQAQAKPGPSQQEEQPLDDDSKVMPWEKEKSDEEEEEKSTADSEEETWEGQPPAYDSEDEDQAALEQEYFEEEFELEIPGKASPPSPARKYGQGGIPPGEYYRVVKGPGPPAPAPSKPAQAPSKPAQAPSTAVPDSPGRPAPGRPQAPPETQQPAPEPGADPQKPRRGRKRTRLSMRMSLVSDRRASGAAAGPGPSSEAAAAAAGQLLAPTRRVEAGVGSGQQSAEAAAAAAGQLSAPPRRAEAGAESGQQPAVGPVVEAAEAPVQPHQQGDREPDSEAAVSMMQQQRQEGDGPEPEAERKPAQDVEVEEAKREESPASQQAADRAADQKKRAAFEKRWKESRQQTEAKHQAGKDKPEGSGRKVKMPQWHVSREDEAAALVEPGYYAQQLKKVGLLTPELQADPRWELFNVALNNIILNFTQWESVLLFVRDVGHTMTEVNLSTSAHRLARFIKKERTYKVAVRNHPEFPKLLKYISIIAPSFSHRQQANCLWAFGVIGGPEARTCMQDILKVFKRQPIGKMEPQEISNICWAIGKQFLTDEKDTVWRLCNAALAMGLSQFPGQGISNISWTLARLSLQHHEFLEECGNNCAKRISTLQPLPLANTVWAFGFLGKKHHRLFDACAKSLVGTKDKDGNEVWKARIGHFGPQELSNVLLAFTRVQLYNEELLQANEVTATAKLQASELETLAKLQVPHAMKPQAVTNLLWSFANLRYYPAKLLDFLVGKDTDEPGYLKDRLSTMNDQETANLLWSFAKFGYHPLPLVPDFLAAIDRLLNQDSMGPQSLANSLWALGVFQTTSNPTFRRCLERLGSVDIALISAKQLHQLFQAIMLVKAEAERRGDRHPSEQLQIPLNVQHLAARLWKITVQDVHVSALHREVSDCLAHMGVAHLLEHLAVDGLFSLDIVLLPDSPTRICIEVDGPYHYTVNTLQPMGHTLIRRRLLKLFGWSVITVPYYDWWGLRTPVKRIDYLLRLLAPLARTFGAGDLPPTLCAALQRGSAEAVFAAGPAAGKLDELSTFTWTGMRWQLLEDACQPRHGKLSQEDRKARRDVLNKRRLEAAVAAGGEAVLTSRNAKLLSVDVPADESDAEDDDSDIGRLLVRIYRQSQMHLEARLTRTMTTELPGVSMKTADEEEGEDDSGADDDSDDSETDRPAGRQASGQNRRQAASGQGHRGGHHREQGAGPGQEQGSGRYDYSRMSWRLDPQRGQYQVPKMGAEEAAKAAKKQDKREGGDAAPQGQWVREGDGSASPAVRVAAQNGASPSSGMMARKSRLPAAGGPARGADPTGLPSRDRSSPAAGAAARAAAAAAAAEKRAPHEAVTKPMAPDQTGPNKAQTETEQHKAASEDTGYASSSIMLRGLPAGREKELAQRVASLRKATLNNEIAVLLTKHGIKRSGRKKEDLIREILLHEFYADREGNICPPPGLTYFPQN